VATRSKSFLIKLGKCSLERGSWPNLPSLSSHHGGGEIEMRRSITCFSRSAEREERKTAEVFESSSSADLRWPRASSPPTSLAEGRLLQDLVLEAAWHLLDLNLQAVVPMRRPLFCSDAGSLAYIAQSGAVPGGDAGACGWLQKFIAGGEVLDGVSCAKVRVLYVKSPDYVMKVYL
jgi:hypothetical protein